MCLNGIEKYTVFPCGEFIDLLFWEAENDDEHSVQAGSFWTSIDPWWDIIKKDDLFVENHTNYFDDRHMAMEKNERVLNPF